MRIKLRNIFLILLSTFILVFYQNCFDGGTVVDNPFDGNVAVSLLPYDPQGETKAWTQPVGEPEPTEVPEEVFEVNLCIYKVIFEAGREFNDFEHEVLEYGRLDIKSEGTFLLADDVPPLTYNHIRLSVRQQRYSCGDGLDNVVVRNTYGTFSTNARFKLRFYDDYVITETFQHIELDVQELINVLKSVKKQEDLDSAIDSTEIGSIAEVGEFDSPD